MSALVKTIKSRLTDDTIYPVTKADAVYMGSSTVTTVEGQINDIKDIIGDTTLPSINDTLTSLLVQHNEKLSTTILKDVCQGSGTVGVNTNAAIVGDVPQHSGYTFAGIIGIISTVGANGCITDFSVIDATKVRCVLRNVSSNSLSATIKFTLLYVKSSVYQYLG